MVIRNENNVPYFEEIFQTNKTTINLSKHLKEYDAEYANFKIKGIKVEFHDKDGSILPREGSGMESKTNVTVLKPRLYQNSDVNGKRYKFYGNWNHRCRSIYTRGK